MFQVRTNEPTGSEWEGWVGASVRPLNSTAPTRFFRLCIRAFSSEAGTGSREENASNKKPEPGFDSIKAGKALE